MLDWFNRLPVWAQGVLLVGGFAVFAIAGLLVTRPRIRSRVGSDGEHNERVIFMVEAVAILYALLLGLVAFGAYDHYNEVKELANRESAILGTLYRQAQALPNEERCKLQSVLDEFMHYTIDEVWPQQAKGMLAQAHGRTDAIQKAIISYETTNTAETSAQFVMFERYGEFSDARRERQMQVEIGVQPVLYLVLFMGALVVVALTWFLSLDRRGDQMAISGILAAFIGLFLFLIVVLDYPLKESNAISSTAWKVAVQNVIIEPEDGRIPGCANTINEYVNTALIEAGRDPLY